MPGGEGTQSQSQSSSSNSNLQLIQLQQHQLQQQQQQLTQFWQDTITDIQAINPETEDFKTHQLPLARIKKIMKSDEDVKMISAEAPVMFAKACEIFILELTLRAWNHTEENKRRTLQRNDIAMAITKTDTFDFLIDIVPRDDIKPTKKISPEQAAYYYLQQPVMQGPGVPGAPAMQGGVVDPQLLYQQQAVMMPPFMQQQMALQMQQWQQQQQQMVQYQQQQPANTQQAQGGQQTPQQQQQTQQQQQLASIMGFTALQAGTAGQSRSSTVDV